MKDRYRPWLLLWSALLGKITTWRNSCAKGILGLIVTKRSKRAPTPKRGTVKDQKAIMP